MHQRSEYQAQLDEDNLDAQSRMRITERIQAIDRVMGEMEHLSGDPLVDLWEAQMEAGIEPDLDMTMEDLKRGKPK